MKPKDELLRAAETCRLIADEAVDDRWKQHWLILADWMESEWNLHWRASSVTAEALAKPCFRMARKINEEAQP